MKQKLINETRNLIAFALVAVLALGLTACSNPRENNPNVVGKNTDNSLSLITTWTSSGLINHFDSKTNCDVFRFFLVEGLWGYINTTDKVYCKLASEMPIHTTENMDDYKDVMGQDVYDFFKKNGCSTVTVTTGKIRPEAKWHNGDDFKAKDVWSYYYIVHPTSSNYMAAVKIVDDKTIQFIWNPLKEPDNEVKNLLLAQDLCGTVKYEEFAEFADAAYKLVMEGEVNENVDVWGAFSRTVSAEQLVVLDEIRNDFYECDPSWYVATGPFKMETFSATQILLTKNTDYWAADKIGFDKIKLYTSSDVNQTLQMVADGTIDYYNGFIQPDTLEQLLMQNEDLVNFKLFDMGAIGIIFNTSNPLLSDIRVREALQYVFDREAITMAANPYGTTSYYTMLGMPPIEAEANMSEEHFKELVEYSYDQDKAAQLLTEAGWEKKDGAWYADGKLVEFNMGTEAGFATAFLAAEPAAAQLNAFGIKCNLLQSDNFLSLAYEENSPYDMFCQWTDLNAIAFHPSGSYQLFSSAYSRWAHLDRYDTDYEDVKKRDQLKIAFDGLDGDTNTYLFADYISNFYSYDPEELTYLIDVFNIGIAKECLGVPFFQNVTAATWNLGKITGFPLQDYWTEDRNVTYIPKPGADEYYENVATNLYWSGSYNFIFGYLQPNKAQVSDQS